MFEGVSAGTSPLTNVMDQLHASAVRQNNPAIGIAEELLATMKACQEGLPAGDEMSVSVPALPPGARVSDIRRLGAHLLVFGGSLADGRPFTVLQHCSLVSVCMAAEPMTRDEPRRIGFGS